MFCGPREHLRIVWVFPPWCDSTVGVVDAGLEDGVTDRGLSALASAGCGAKLTTLTLWGECLYGVALARGGARDKSEGTFL